MVIINEAQVEKIAEILKKLPESGIGLNFYSYMKDGKEIVDSEKFPPLNHPQTMNFLFFAVMHDYGFWYGDDKGYLEPLYGTFNGKKIKGSDLLWMACRRYLYQDGVYFNPDYLQNIKPQELAGIFSDVNGPIIWPNFEERFKITRAYGKWFVEKNITPSYIVNQSNAAQCPLEFFLSWTREIPGYNTDPFFMKKNTLLAMILANRPEKFLRVTDSQNWKPIIDYHLMRVCLRLGFMELSRARLKANMLRRWTVAPTEMAIREATYEAVMGLIEKSGKQMSLVDEKMWMGREYCPEMETPDCSKCIFDSVCKKRVELFQPIFRTTNY